MSQMKDDNIERIEPAILQTQQDDSIRETKEENLNVENKENHPPAIQQTLPPPFAGFQFRSNAILNSGKLDWSQNTLFYSIHSSGTQSKQNKAETDTSIPLLPLNDEKQKQLQLQEVEEAEKEMQNENVSYFRTFLKPSQEPKGAKLRSAEKKKPLPSSIYTAAPIKSGQTTPLRMQQSAIYQKLLPDMEATLENTTDTDHSLPNAYRDLWAGVLYKLLLIAMLVIGLVLIFTTRSFQQEISNSLFYAIRKSSSLFFSFMSFSFLIGILWILLLKTFLRPMIWLTVWMIPFLFFGISSLNFISIFTVPLKQQDNWFILQSILSFILGIISSYFLKKRKEQIDKSIEFIELAFQIVSENPSILVMSLLVLLTYMVFFCVWLFLFSRIFLIGKIERNGDTITWIPNDISNYLMVFFLGMFFWTSSLFSYIERCSISGVVCEWFFHRHNPVRRQARRDMAFDSLKRSLTFSFGSLTLASLILSCLQVVKMILSTSKRLLGISRNPILSIFYSCFELLESLVEGVNGYVIVYVAYSGDSFFQSTKKCLQLFRQEKLAQQISPLLLDQLSKFILHFGIYFLSLTSFFITFQYGLSFSTSRELWILALVASVLPFFMVRFCVCLLTQVMDSLYICYLIDLEQDGDHCPRVRTLFGLEKEVVFESDVGSVS